MLINKTNVRRAALELANKKANADSTLPDTYTDSNGRVWNYSSVKRAPLKRYTQVSPEFFDTIDAKVRNVIDQHIKNMPRGGKTIK